MTLYTAGTSAQQNCLKLQEAAQTVFLWAAENAVQFDDSKSELIHFTKQRKLPEDSVTLSNGTIIKSVKEVKWLGI